MDQLLSILRQIDPFSYFAMGILLLMSVYSWAVIIKKLVTFSRIEKNTKRYVSEALKKVSFADLTKISENYPALPAQALFLECIKELSRLRKVRPDAQWSVLELDVLLGRTSQSVLLDFNRKFESQLSVLASIASTAPFVGLFGTVTGVIHTLYNMAGSAGQDQFGSVAPGLSIALTATAFGLFVAIPAVLAFNYFRSKLRFLNIVINDFKLYLLNRLIFQS